MTSYHYIHWSEREPGLAHTDKHPVLDLGLTQPEEFSGWTPLPFSLTEGEALDYLGNNVGVRLCSPKLRAIIERFSPPGRIQWLEAPVSGEGTESVSYSILHFIENPDVIDWDASIVAGSNRSIVKAVLLGDQLEGEDVFGFGTGTLRIVVSNRVRDAIVEAGCTGIEFSGVPVSPAS